MAITTTYSPEFPINALMKGCMAFGVSGVGAGLFFAWLTSLPALQFFWYFKSDKLRIPTYRYWLAFSLIFLLALIMSYFIAYSYKWLPRPDSYSIIRRFLSALIILVSAPALYFITIAVHLSWNIWWNILILPLVFVILVALALCVLVNSFRYLWLAVILNVLAELIGFVFFYCAIQMIGSSSDWYDFVQWSIIEGMLAAASGIWLIWQERKVNRNAFYN